MLGGRRHSHLRIPSRGSRSLLSAESLTFASPPLQPTGHLPRGPEPAVVARRGRGRGLGQARVLRDLGVGGADLGPTGPLAHAFIPMILQGTDTGGCSGFGSEAWAGRRGPWLDSGPFRGHERGFSSGVRHEVCVVPALLA